MVNLFCAVAGDQDGSGGGGGGGGGGGDGGRAPPRIRFAPEERMV